MTGGSRCPLCVSRVSCHACLHCHPFGLDWLGDFPAVVADFDLDGVSDVLLLTRSGYYGLHTSLGTGSVAVQVLFCFCAVAVVLTLVLRQQESAPAPTPRERLHAS